MSGLTRRQLLIGGLGVGVTALAGRVVHQRMQSGPEGHSPYFQQMSRVLHDADVIRPHIVIDQARAKANLDQILKRIRPRYAFRIVTKSLPSLPMLEWIMAEADTNRLMVFNEPFLHQLTERFPDSDILFGKPLNVQAARHYYRHRDAQSGFDPEAQLQWLIDTPTRLREYTELAEALDTSMRLSIEIDVGLHRGGVEDVETLADMVATITEHPRLSLAGLMGYEAHIVRAPGSIDGFFRKAMERYEAFTQTAMEVSGLSRDELILDAGGSTTYDLYPGADVMPNELAIGTSIVQPTDFDLPTTTAHIPAFFIAAPLLKAWDGLKLPGGPGLGTLMAMWDRRFEQTFFIDRGNWKARPESPETLRLNPLYGRSSNQDMVNGPSELALGPGDFVFFRPTQSEAVMRQFGELLVYDPEAGAIRERWAPFSL